MTSQEKLFYEIGEKLKGAEKSQMFGKPCFKTGGKAFICFFQNEMVFKLSGVTHGNALKLKGAQLFDPSGKKRPMKEWVQVPYDFSDKWQAFSRAAMKYVEENL